jgi:hypothetical protein
VVELLVSFGLGWLLSKNAIRKPAAQEAHSKAPKPVYTKPLPPPVAPHEVPWPQQMIPPDKTAHDAAAIQAAMNPPDKTAHDAAAIQAAMSPPDKAADDAAAMAAAMDS